MVIGGIFVHYFRVKRVLFWLSWSPYVEFDLERPINKFREHAVGYLALRCALLNCLRETKKN
ncbi:unnamed protein product [Urochloa humidicola]